MRSLLGDRGAVGITVVDIQFEPGMGLANIGDVKFEEEVDSYAGEQLSNARKAAENWRTGLAGLAALVATVSVVKGRDSIAMLPIYSQIALGLLVGGALVAAVVGATIALRAAYGWPGVTVVTRPSQLRERRFEEARKIRSLLMGAIAATYISVALLFAAVAITWYSPSVSPAVVRVTVGSAAVCGEVVKSDGGTIHLKLGRTEKVIQLSEVRDLAVIGRCP